MTVSVCVVVRLGEPLSVTRTRMLFVLGPCASFGLQLKTPVFGSIAAFAGAPDREKVTCWAGRSESDAATVKFTDPFSGTVLEANAGTSGGLFTLLTVTVKLLLSVKAGEPLSETRIVIG